MRLNKSTSHAIRILINCAHAEGNLVKVADLSAALGITMQNVFKIVHILSHSDLIAAMRGRNGGVRLARSANEIRIGDIVRAMESTEIELDIDGHPARGAASAVKGVNRVLDDALEAFVAVLDQHTLADMAGKASLAKVEGGGLRRKSTQLPSVPAGSRTRPTARSAGK